MADLQLFFKAHQGVGYLVLALTGLVALWALIDSLQDSRPSRLANILSSITVGLVDLQVLAGFVLYFLYPADLRPSWTHPFVMIVALVAVHVGNRQISWSRFGSFTAGFVLLLMGWMLIL